MTTTTPDIPLIDIAAWRDADAADRSDLAARLDRAMQDSGFFLVSGHGIPTELTSGIRAAAREFFALPTEVKATYETTVSGRGWLAPGREANAFYGEQADATRADMKESLTCGRSFSTGDPAVDREWFTPNVWPAEVPRLQALCDEFAEAARDLYYDLLEMLAVALTLPATYFTERAQRSPHTFNINRYPALDVVGAAQDGQYRVAPHTDWGILTILDRQPGYGGLQVQGADGQWSDAPFVEGALTINIADLLARWTGDRWRSTRHRVLPPSPDAPHEELISLIMFMECDMDSTVTPLAPPVGGGVDHPAVVAGAYFRERSDAASVVG